MGKCGKIRAILLRNLQTVRDAMQNLSQRHCTIKAGGDHSIGLVRGPGRAIKTRGESVRTTAAFESSGAQSVAAGRSAAISAERRS